MSRSLLLIPEHVEKEGDMKGKILISPQTVYHQILTSKVIHIGVWLISMRGGHKHPHSRVWLSDDAFLLVWMEVGLMRVNHD